MYYYIILNGRKLPTPYTTLRELDEACEELRKRLGPCIIGHVYE